MIFMQKRSFFYFYYVPFLFLFLLSFKICFFFVSFLFFSFFNFFCFIRFDEAKEEYGKAIEIVIEQLKELSLKEEKGKNEETEKEKESNKEQQKQKEDKIPNEIEKFAAICYANRAACFLTKEKFLLFLVQFIV